MLIDCGTRMAHVREADISDGFRHTRSTFGDRTSLAVGPRPQSGTLLTWPVWQTMSVHRTKAEGSFDPNETSASSIILALCRSFWNAPIDRVCVENPLMHRHGKERIPRR
jgi:hypothetical protein